MGGYSDFSILKAHSFSGAHMDVGYQDQYFPVPLCPDLDMRQEETQWYPGAQPSFELHVAPVFFASALQFG
jgi:hypothetical protein